MHKPGGNCNDLMKKTVDALSSEPLQQLFVLTQQNNLDICVEYGIKAWGDMICRFTTLTSFLEWWRQQDLMGENT